MRFKLIADAALDALNTALAALPSPPSRVGVVAGAIAWDSCGECGQLSVTLARVFLSNTFPNPDIAAQGNCGSTYLCAGYAAAIVRCWPSQDEGGQPPSVLAEDRAAQIVMDDAETAVPALACALEELVGTHTIDEYAVGLGPIVGPTGGCIGTQIDFTVGWTR